MKRDMELVRKILLAIEGQESGYAPKDLMINGYTQEQILYHVFIMIEGGLIEGIKVNNFNSKSPEAIPTRLTWSGHEFIEVARNDTLWKKAMTIVQEKGGSISISVLSQLLTSLMKNAFNLP